MLFLKTILEKIKTNLNIHLKKTHRSPDEEHRDGSNKRNISDQRFQDHPELSMQLKSAEKIFVILFHAIQQKFCSSPVPDAHLNSFHSSFAEVLLHLHIDLHVASIATNRESSSHRCRRCFSSRHLMKISKQSHLIYRSSNTWRLSCSVWAFTPTTFTGCTNRNQLNFMNLKNKILNYNIKQVKSIKAWHLVPQIHFGEAECLKMSVGGSDRGCNRLHQKLL